MSSFIITFTPYFKKSVEKELKAIDSSMNFEMKLDDSKFLISSKLDQGDFWIG